MATEVLRRVFSNESIMEGAYIEVGPDGDALGCVEIRSGGWGGETYFGKLSLVLPRGLAEELGHALLAAARKEG